MPQDPEIAELIADIKERVLYLQELGVGSLRVELPGSSRSVGSSKLIVDSSLPARAETLSPRSSTAQAASPGSRLTSLPSLSKRRESSTLPHSAASGAPSAASEEMPPTIMGDSGVPVVPPLLNEETLFGEIGPALPASGETVEDIWADVGNCMRCPLFEGRTQIVHTTGNYNADLMFIGEAPGKDEDEQGEPFVGRAGQLLNKIIEAIGMTRSEVAIGNINRCRPPANRAPTLPEAHACRPFLLREIAAIRPKVIVVLGNTALHNLLDTKVGITKVRGKFQDYFGVKVMPTFHPAYLLRDPHKKKEVWEDMKMVRDYLNSFKG